MSNRLQYEASPYLLQHADNPVDWYPWGREAFEKAKREEKPVFLSIGYSTCHWCHVMARESFEDREIAALLNRSFIPVKVDKEERPDVDSVYMRFCLAFTGSGGWPTSILMTADQKPFFAGTYFPKHSRGGMIGLYELLSAVEEQWRTDRQGLLLRSEELTRALRKEETPGSGPAGDLFEKAFLEYEQSFDAEYGGFGSAPKFPAPQNLLFLLSYSRQTGNRRALEMAERTLLGMYRGGLFDHVGGGWCRYSTDRRFLVPHFEKMLYDNALLILAACRCAEQTEDKALARLLLHAAERTGDYVLREMTGPEGGFYSAQDADSEGGEGSYYLFTPDHIASVLSEAEAEAFCRRYDITRQGNFNGKSIPNLLRSNPFEPNPESELRRVFRYRGQRMKLHTDTKILTAWNGLMIAALCALYRSTRKDLYLDAARAAEDFIRRSLWKEDGLYAGISSGRLGARGFLDDHAAWIFALLELYGVCLDQAYLDRAERLCKKTLAEFEDRENGGLFLSGRGAETLVLRPKETYDGAMPSGNSLMAWNLVRLSLLTGKPEYQAPAERQLSFMEARAAEYPAGFAMYLLARLMWENPSTLTVVRGEREDPTARLLELPAETAVRLLVGPTEAYPLPEGRTTYYLCRGHRCYPPTDDWQKLLDCLGRDAPAEGGDRSK